MTASTSGPKTFNLLTIGQRGVGKTVFMAGSYAELQARTRTNHEQLWFDCQNDQSQQNLEKILNYVGRTGHYPPPTTKISDFSFSLIRRYFWGTRKLCNFRWRDVPGELCESSNREFREMVLSSHGCCVFVDAQAVVHDPAYLQGLQDIIQQISIIASLVHLNRLKYVFAIVLTKCDLVLEAAVGDTGSLSPRLKQGIKPLTESLDTFGVQYKVFRSVIPIKSHSERPALDATGGADAILWLVWELSRAYNSGWQDGLFKFVRGLLPNRTQPRSMDGVLQNLIRQADGPGSRS
ncbi:MAG: hypothetical protein H7Y22_10925 [Gemmatimonadaceae bacterium]|nr:hypothetical protein [Gloeobacterales cyanobacterium ES-bin-141]